MHAILSEEPASAKALRDDLPDVVLAILKKALARDRDQRYQNVAEMTVALRAAMAAVAPDNSPPDLARFMVSLFGPDAMARRSHVPTLGEINLAEVVSPRATGSVPILAAETAGRRLRGPNEETSRTETATSLERIPPSRRARWVWLDARTAAVAAVGLALVVALAVVGRPRPAPRAARPAVRPPSIFPVPGTPTPPALAAPAETPPPPVVATPREGPPPAAAPAERPRRSSRPRFMPSSQGPARLGGQGLQAVVARAQPRFSACFRTHAAALSTATGQATVELVVTSSGKVSSASASLPAVSAPALGRCLELEALRLRFPRHPDREIRFSFPLVYRKGQ
jgi:serine/threonine-protein kinase